MADSYLKTKRAKTHLEELRSALRTFYESEPCRFLREDDLENGCHIVRVQIAETPDDITLIAGDLFYCLRSALDQLLWCLIKTTGAAYPEDTQFPIFQEPNDPLLEKRVQGVPVGALSIIKTLQPYNAANKGDFRSHHLWRLNKLCNIDKHMRIPVYGSTGLITWPPGVIGPDISFNDDGVMRVALSRRADVSVDPSVAFEVVFGDLYWGVACKFEDIEQIYEYVTNSVIPKFAGFFK